jgi:hypothetical protein
MKRNLIQKNENQNSVLQIIGFVMMLSAITCLIIASFFTSDIICSVVSVSFFVTMIGFSFAFPSLLKGNKGLSTMRIVVFMITNVVCMLLLKIGWSKNIHSLKDIGLDQYWMGVIAFVFGAKATQSFFESRMAPPSSSIPSINNQADHSTINNLIPPNNPIHSSLDVFDPNKINNDPPSDPPSYHSKNKTI